jgi:tRNA modification GTPase
MSKEFLDDTIAAISTPVGEGGIGIVRLSGQDALKIADKIFLSKDGRKPSQFKTYTMHYGFIVEGVSSCLPQGGFMKDKIIDEVILSVMRRPRSYTREDIVEINSHGGIVPLTKILDLALASGARLAEPGEFTKRAFLNGRLDLTQAEAVLDIIRAKTGAALSMGLGQLKGELGVSLGRIRQILLEALAILEAGIDFPEDEPAQINPEKVARGLALADKQAKGMLVDSSRSMVMREGLHVVICGRPNVGKSSLLNALLKRERSIVTPVAGTTRDTVEDIIDIRGIPVRIVDTAGILEPRDLIEKKAVAKAKEQIRLADLVLILFDASRKLSAQDQLLMRRLKNKQCIALINKIDLRPKLEKEKIAQAFSRVIEISARKFKNLDLLEDAIEDLVYRGKVICAGAQTLSNLRHINGLRLCEKFIADSIKSLDNKLPPEFIAQDIKEAISELDQILGKSFSAQLLDKIFSEFCIGK